MSVETHDRKFTTQELVDAIQDLSTIPYFPYEAKPSVMRELAAMCPHYRALRWTTETAMAQCSVWPGLAELRGVLCSRFDAADGVDVYSSLPGFRAEDGERRSLEAHQAHKLDCWEADALLALSDGKPMAIKQLSAGQEVIK